MQEKLLVVLLRFVGVVTVTAFLTIFLPVDWMVWTHRRLGLGDFPESALVDYLTRSIAALYGFQGVLLLLVSTNVRRFRPFVTYVGWMHLIFGAALIAIDLHAGMPLFWTLGEGPPIIAIGAAILYLRRFVSSDRTPEN